MKSAVQLRTVSGYEILDYLLRHPQAQDTLDGIVEWWILEQRIVTADAQVREALAELTKRKFVRKRQTRDGRLLYSLNLDKKAQISAILEKSSPFKKMG